MAPGMYGQKKDLRNLDGKEKFEKRHSAEIKEYLGFETGFFEQLAEKADREKGRMGWGRRWSELDETEEMLQTMIKERDEKNDELRRNFQANQESEIKDGRELQGRDYERGRDTQRIHQGEEWKKTWGLFGESKSKLNLDIDGNLEPPPEERVGKSWWSCFGRKKKLARIEAAKEELQEEFRDHEYYRRRGERQPEKFNPRVQFVRNASAEEQALELKEKPKLQKAMTAVLEKVVERPVEPVCHTGLLPTDVNIKDKRANKINLAQIMINAKMERWKQKHPLNDELQQRVVDDEEEEAAYQKRKAKRDRDARFVNRKAASAKSALITTTKTSKSMCWKACVWTYKQLKDWFLFVVWIIQMILTIFILYPLDAVFESFEDSYVGKTFFPCCKRPSKKKALREEKLKEREIELERQSTMASLAVERADKRRRRERRRRNRMRRLKTEAKKRRAMLRRMRESDSDDWSGMDSDGHQGDDVSDAGSDVSGRSKTSGTSRKSDTSSSVSKKSMSTKTHISKKEHDEEHMAILDAAIMRKEMALKERKQEHKQLFPDISESEDASEDEFAGMGKETEKGKSREKHMEADGTMSASGLMSFLFDNINNWMGKCGILMLTSSASFPDGFSGFAVNTSFLANFGMGDIDLGFPASRHFVLGGQMTFFAFIFARGCMMHTQYCSMVPTDQTGLWIYDPNENLMKADRSMEGEVWWSDWLSHYFLRFWIRANHQDNIPCRQWWEFFNIHRFWPKWISSAHRDWCMGQDREFFLLDTIYKGQMMEKRETIWAKVVAVVNSRGDKDWSKVGWYQCMDSAEQGKARSKVFWPEVTVLKETINLSTKPLLDPDEEPADFAVCMLMGGERVQFLDFQAFPRKDVSLSEAGTLLGKEGKGEQCMVIDVGPLNRATESRTVIVRNMRTKEVASMQHDMLQPARAYSSPHLDRTGWYTWYLNQGYAFHYIIFNVFVVPALWGIPMFYFWARWQEDEGNDPFVTLPELAFLPAGFDYSIGYFFCFGMMGMFIGAAGADLTRILFLRQVWGTMHYMDSSMTEVYELKLAECNFDAVSTGLRPQLQATYDYWTAIPPAEIGWMFTLLQAWQMPTVNGACSLAFIRYENPEEVAGDVAVQWTENMFDLGWALFAFIFCTGGLVSMFLITRITKETEYGSESATEYACEMFDAFRTPVRSAFKELNLIESTMFGLAAIYFKGEAQIMACLYLTVSGFIIVALIPIFNDPRPNRSLFYTKLTLTMLLSSAYVNIKYGTKYLYDDAGNMLRDEEGLALTEVDPQLSQIAEALAWGSFILVSVETVWEIGPIEQYKAFKKNREEQIPLREVGKFMKHKAKTTKVKHWNERHFRALTVDQRGWLLEHHLPTLEKKWRVLDFGSGEHGPALQSLRNNGANMEFMALDPKDPNYKGLEILACQDCPTITRFPEGVKECKYLKILNFASCYNLAGPLPAWVGDLPLLERLYLDETQLWDPIPPGKVLSCHVERPKWIGVLHIWKETPSIEDFDDRVNSDYQVYQQQTRVLVDDMKDIGGGRMLVHVKKWFDEWEKGQIIYEKQETVAEIQKRKRAEAQGIFVAKAIKDPADFEGWCDAMCIDRHVKGEEIGKPREKKCADLHLVEDYVKERWEHLNLFQWSWGEKMILQQRIESDRKLQSMLG